jgi:hypothetical protein
MANISEIHSPSSRVWAERLLRFVGRSIPCIDILVHFYCARMTGPLSIKLAYSSAPPTETHIHMQHYASSAATKKANILHFLLNTFGVCYCWLTEAQLVPDGAGQIQLHKEQNQVAWHPHAQAALGVFCGGAVLEACVLREDGLQ